MFHDVSWCSMCFHVCQICHVGGHAKPGEFGWSWEAYDSAQEKAWKTSRKNGKTVKHVINGIQWLPILKLFEMFWNYMKRRFGFDRIRYLISSLLWMAFIACRPSRPFCRCNRETPTKSGFGRVGISCTEHSLEKTVSKHESCTVLRSCAGKGWNLPSLPVEAYCRMPCQPFKLA